MDGGGVDAAHLLGTEDSVMDGGEEIVLWHMLKTAIQLKII
jgi:hypothetical protein